MQVKSLRIQRRMFRENRRELTRSEYARLLSAARSQGRERLALLMESICATGIRVSEVEHLTVGSSPGWQGGDQPKGKDPAPFSFPAGCGKNCFSSPIKRKPPLAPHSHQKQAVPFPESRIWAEMKSLCRSAGVMATKVFPHNLRHLFARAFYQVSHDIAKLADVLGHSSIETTRIYLISTSTEHERQLERLRLVY